MILAALAAFAAQTATPPAGWNDDEVFCVADKLTPEKGGAAADEILEGTKDALVDAMVTAEEARAECTRKWGWDSRKALLSTVMSAASIGMSMSEQALKPRFTQDQLIAIFHRLSDEDQATLTIEGVQRLEPAKREAFGQRFRTLVNDNAKSDTDRQYLASWLMFAARYGDAESAWISLLESKK